MKQFKIFKNPMGQYEAVKIGWSWPGFFFTWIWAGIKGLWGHFAWLLAVFIVTNLVAISDNLVLLSVAAMVSLGVSIAIGSQGNTMRETNLTSRGFQFQKIVNGANPEGAVAKYMSDEITVSS